jgi:hypothetical protein
MKYIDELAWTFWITTKVINDNITTKVINVILLESFKF